MVNGMSCSVEFSQLCMAHRRSEYTAGWTTAVSVLMVGGQLLGQLPSVGWASTP